jgi:arylsulfatase A-like enzyme
VLWVPAACRRPPPFAGPIVLITFDSLRADMVSGIAGTGGGGTRPGLMPHLEELARRADWAGRGIASSSWEVPSMASLFTGLRPWQHQAITAGQAEIAPGLPTLPEALAKDGYATAGFWSGHWYSDKLGYARGFTVYRSLGRGNRAAQHLAALGGGRQFVWIHLPEPRAPYVRRDAFLARLGPGAPQALPRRILADQLQAFLDPSRPLTAANRRRLSAMYELNAAFADQRLGRFLSALRQSGQWDRTLLVITANHGEALGEGGRVLHGGSLGRPLLEVPLVVKLPRGFTRRIAEPRGSRVAVARLWATVVEAVGETAPPAMAPSLFRHDGEPILSELYLNDGVNLFSLLDGGDQLLFESRFAPAAFDASLPLSGASPPRLTLMRWDSGGSHAVDDPVRAREMARRLIGAWRRFVPDELTPAEEREARAPIPAVTPPHPLSGGTG